MDTAEFLLRLVDEVSGPSAAASSALRGLVGQMRATSQAGGDIFKGVSASTGILNKARLGLAQKGVVGKSGTGALLGAPDISKFTEGAGPSRWQRIQNGLVAAWRGWGHEGKKAAADIEGASKHMELGGEFLHRAMEFAVGGLLERAAEKAMEFGKELATDVLHMASFQQTAEMAFSTFGQDFNADGAKVLEHVDGLIERFGLNIEQTISRYEEFLGMGMNPDQADDLIKVTADMRAFGASAENADAALNAMLMMKSMGSLSSRMMRPLARAGISVENVMKELGAITGQSMGGLKVAFKNGTIDADVGMRAILNAIKNKAHEGKLGEVGEKWANTTLEGMWGKLKAGLDAKIIDKIASVMTPVFSEALSGWLEDFTKFAESDAGTKFFTDLAVGIRDFTKALVEALPKLTELLKLAGMLVTNRKATEGGGPAGEAYSPIGALFGGAAGLGLGGPGGAAAGAAGGGALAAWLNGLAPIRAFNKYFGLKEFADQGNETGVQIGQGLIDGLDAKNPDLLAAGQRAGSTVISGIASPEGVDAHSPSRKGTYLGQMTGVGFGLGLSASMNDNAVLAAGLGADVAAAASVGAERVSMALPAASLSAGTGFTGGGSVGAGQVHVEVNITGVEGDPEKVAVAAKRGTLEGLGDAFDQLATEAA